jgi:hypothetical protein
MPKIYVDDGAAVAISGMSNLGGELFSSFVNRNQFLLARPVIFELGQLPSCGPMTAIGLPEWSA